MCAMGTAEALIVTRRTSLATLDIQSWRTAVELVNGTFVRVIERGVVSIKSFERESEAIAFAASEKKRLGLS